MLSAGQQGLAERFAAPLVAGWGGIEFEAGIGGVPLLAGCAARFECRHAAGYDGGDHLIVVGEVLRVSEGHRPPLLFYRGRYSALEGGVEGG